MKDKKDEVVKAKENRIQKTFRGHFAVAFWITLLTSIVLMITGFFMPPIGIIDGSVVAGAGVLILWPSLGLGARAIDEGRSAKLKTRHAVLTVGEDNEDDE
jgi:hypothetical protein